MPSTITITCPECDKQLKAPSDIVGKKIRCKGCGATFAARDEDEKPAKKEPAKKEAPKKEPAKAKAPPAGGEDEEAGAYGVTDQALGNRCPHCANKMESEDAVVCLHCGYNTITRQHTRTRKVVDQTGLDIFLWLLPGIVCVLTIILLLVIDIVYCLKIDDLVDTTSFFGGILASKGIKLWLCLVSIFFMYLAGKFAVKRLIIHNTPPEIEETV